MMKTSKEFMEWLGLRVGDRIHLFEDKARDFDEGIYQIIKEQSNDYPTYYVFENIDDSDDRYSIKSLIDLDFEILPRPKRVGELTCNYFKDCDNCPLRILFCDRQTDDEDTLYDILNRWNNEYVNFDQEIYDLLKARLDKEVE